MGASPGEPPRPQPGEELHVEDLDAPTADSAAPPPEGGGREREAERSTHQLEHASQANL